MQALSENDKLWKNSLGIGFSKDREGTSCSVVWRSCRRRKGWKMDTGGQAESLELLAPDKPMHSFARCGGRAEGGAWCRVEMDTWCLLFKAGSENWKRGENIISVGSENTVCFQEECFLPGALVSPSGQAIWVRKLLLDPRDPPLEVSAAIFLTLEDTFGEVESSLCSPQAEVPELRLQGWRSVTPPPCFCSSFL